MSSKDNSAGKEIKMWSGLRTSVVIAVCVIVADYPSAANVPVPTPEPEKAPRKPLPAKRALRICDKEVFSCQLVANSL